MVLSLSTLDNLAFIDPDVRRPYSLPEITDVDVDAWSESKCRTRTRT